MSSDDSINDSDEVFNLYSSKKVTATFKAQLKKIVASNHQLTNALSQINNDKICSKKEEEKISEKIPLVLRKQELNLPHSITDEKLTEDISPNEINEISSVEDSVEIIQEFIPTRRSERLRRKKGALELQKSDNVNSDVTVIKQVNHRKRNASKGKKQIKGKAIDEIILNSPQGPEVEDEMNPEISVKIIWKSVNVKKFKIRKFQKLSYIYKLLSKEENIPEDKIILTFNNIRINHNDTPDSLNLQVYHFIDGGVLSDSTNSCSVSVSNTLELNSDVLKLKFQDINKKIVAVNLKKNEKLKIAMIICSEQLEVPLNKIKFFFDGEILQPSETPESLGLENGEVIDMKLTI